ncbi:DUF4344 domain-containing metallopeptidase [Trichothermofontia sp.]
MAQIKSILLAALTAIATGWVQGGCVAAPTLGFSKDNIKDTIIVAIADVGDITINYLPVTDEALQDIYSVLKETQAFEEIADVVNSYLALPVDIPVNFTECGEANAYYDPERQAISMCYELTQAYVDVFTDENASEEEYIKEVINATVFTFFHELGHALVDVLELPITGKEEDVVDEFAAIMLLQSGDEGVAAALAGVAQFSVDAEEETELESLSFWGEHSLSSQRFYNIACFVYGSAPETFSNFIDDDILPAERAQLCEDEYAQKVRSWDILLERYYK